MRNTTPSENMIRRIVAPATHQNIAFFRSVPVSFLVAIPMRIALSPLITRSMRMMFRRAKRPAEVKRRAKSGPRDSNIIELIKNMGLLYENISKINQIFDRGGENVVN